MQFVACVRSVRSLLVFSISVHEARSSVPFIGRIH